MGCSHAHDTVFAICSLQLAHDVLSAVGAVIVYDDHFIVELPARSAALFSSHTLELSCWKQWRSGESAIERVREGQGALCLEHFHQ